MNQKFKIPKTITEKVLLIGVSKSTYGGMAAVLVSYEKHFEKERFIPTWKLANKFIKAIYAFQATVRCFLLLLLDRRIKILHIHGAANASFYRKSIFIKIGKKFGKKVIMHQHAADFENFYNQSNDKGKISSILNLCDVLIVLSHSWEKYFANIGVEKTKIVVLNNIVTPPEATKHSAQDEKLHLLFLGEISNRKGIYDLLNTLKENRLLFQGKLILRIGGNSVDGNLNAFIQENNLSDFCRYEGWISGAKKNECLSWSDIYILPSYNEGLPIAILESMSYCRPIISTNVGGIPEIIKSHFNGIIVEPGNRNQIKDALMFFIENPDKINEYGSNAFKSVVPYFPESVFSNLQKIYEKLL